MSSDDAERRKYSGWPPPKAAEPEKPKAAKKPAATSGTGAGAGE